MKVVGGINYWECPKCNKKNEERFVIIPVNMLYLAYIKVNGDKVPLSCKDGHTSIIPLTA